MKEKDEVKKNTIQMVRAAILQIEKDKNVEVDDSQIIDIIAKPVIIVPISLTVTMASSPPIKFAPPCFTISGATCTARITDVIATMVRVIGNESIAKCADCSIICLYDIWPVKTYFITSKKRIAILPKVSKKSKVCALIIRAKLYVAVCVIKYSIRFIC